MTGWPTGREWDNHPEFVSLVPPDGAPYAHVQHIDGSARVHLDLIVDDRDEEIARLEGLGARRVQPGDHWYVMSSPAGLPFCIASELWPHVRPGPSSWPDGHRSGVVQLCVDVPADSYDTELEFWRAATGWTDEPVDSPQFHRLVHRATSPLQLLVQRLGTDDSGRTRAHLHRHG